jgi:hypothetical protein
MTLMNNIMTGCRSLFLSSAQLALRVSGFWFQEAMTGLQQARTILFCFLLIIALIFLHPMERVEDLVVQVTRGAEQVTEGAIQGLEGNRSGRVVKEVVSPPVSYSPVTYSLSGPDAGFFEIDPSTGEVRLKEKPDYESKRTYVFDVQATRGEATAKQTKRIQLNVINESDTPPPQLAEPKAYRLSENKPASSVVYSPETLGASGPRPLSHYLIQAVRPLIAFLGVILPLAILIHKWRDPSIRKLLYPYMLLLLAEIFTVPIAAAYGNNGSEYAVGATYSLLRVLQLIGMRWLAGFSSRLRWVRRLLLLQLGIWSVNFAGLMLLPF